MSSVLASGLTEGVFELTLYGAFTVLFVAVTYLFSTRGLLSRNRPTFLVFLALVALFVAITVQHWIIGIYVLYLVFIHLGGGLAAEVFYLTLSTPASLAQFSLLEVATVITDSLMVHRLCIVWAHEPRVAIFPIVVLACQIVSGIHVIVDLSRESIFNFYRLSNPWVSTSLVSSLVISVYSTGMIIFKLWRTSHSVRIITGSTSTGKSLRRVLNIMVESAVLQTSMTIGILVSFQAGSLVQAVLTALQPVVFGISVLLIHVRVGLGWAGTVDSSDSTPTGITLNLVSTHRGSRYQSEYDLEQGK
ncbi:hypothetical protein DFH06DRAFT_1409332 [Mycena polygramma]|nr:hypothetical protein DFH06DRAFT_1409332 [Mycena polygramma]